MSGNLWNLSELLYYLPGILFAVFATVAAVWAVFFIRELLRQSKNQVSCLSCKAAAEKTSRQGYLFLLPLSFGDTYEEPQRYLLSHMVPIRTASQIPTGRRACRVEVFTCPRCGKKQVAITDFLLVRGNEDRKQYHIFAYEPFRPLLEAWTEQNLYQMEE